MEVEYFVQEGEWKGAFSQWQENMNAYAEEVGISKDALHELEVEEKERAHYSKRTIDFEFDYPFGRKELWGLAYRTDHDLTSHTEASRENLSYLDSQTNERITPHVIEPSLGVERTVLAVLVSAYTEDELGGEKRIYLKFKYEVAPIKAAVFPLLKNKPELVSKAREVYEMIRKESPQIMFDDNGNIGKRYRRQDEIGTPNCITIDFETLDDEMVTLRDRDTGEQKRIPIKEIISSIKSLK
jgi:glycyl-tRNA synthetase